MVEVEELTCSECGSHTELYEVDGEYYCGSCLDDLFPLCNDCGERFARDDMRINAYGNLICDSCMDDYFSCAECGDLFCHDDVTYSERIDAYVCNGCWCDSEHGDEEEEDSYLINGYHDTDISAWMSINNGSPSIYHQYDYHYGGIELEVEGRDHDGCARAIRSIDPQSNNVRMERDGSLDNGFEIITNPMTWGYFNEMFPLGDILKVCRKKGFKSHDSPNCGLHIHLGMSNFGESQRMIENSIVSCIYILEKFRAEMFKISRRQGSSFSGYVKPYNVDLDTITYQECEDKTQHYSILSIRRDTVELRMFKGTLKEESVRAAWEFYHGLVNVCRQYPLKYIKDFSWNEIRFLISQDMIHLPEYLTGRLGDMSEEITHASITAHMDYIDAKVRACDEMMLCSYPQTFQEVCPVGEYIDNRYTSPRMEYRQLSPEIPDEDGYMMRMYDHVGRFHGYAFADSGEIWQEV